LEDFFEEVLYPEYEKSMETKENPKTSLCGYLSLQSLSIFNLLTWRSKKANP